MTGIERLRLCERQLRADLHELYIKHVWDISVVPLYEEIKECLCALDAIADQIEREIDEAVADEVADTLSAYEMNTNARWHSAVEEGAESDCKAEYELISRYWLPRPRFEDGEPVQFGDEFVSCDGPRVVVGIKYSCEGGISLCDADGELYRFVGRERVKRPVTKVLDADGVEIKVGDEVWLVDDGLGPWTVASIVSNNRVKMTDGSGWGCNAHRECITHRRPEPEDSWERLEADVKMGMCEYFGCQRFGCYDGEDCPAHDAESCFAHAYLDLVRRCKKLAGVE